MADGSSVLNNNSKREAVLPVSNEKRVFSLLSYIGFWLSSTVVIQAFMAGQDFVPPHGELNLLQAIVAIVISSFIVGFMFVVNAQPGMRYGIPFIVQSRSAFGYYGARISSIVRALPAMLWYGVGTWIGVQAISHITEVFWDWSNPALYFAVFLVIQTSLAYFGIETAKWFNSLISILLGAILLYIIIQFLSVGNLEIRDSWQVSGSWGKPFFASITIAVGILLTVSLNISDIARFLENKTKNNWIGHIFGVVPTTLLLYFTGILAAIVTGVWDPIEALISVVPNPIVAVIILIFIATAQVTTNIATNIIPPTMILMEVFNIKWGVSTIIVGILAVVTFPWILISSEGFDILVNGLSTFAGPFLGILIADFYFVRKRKFNTSHLYGGVMKYNWLGIFSLIVGGIMALIFFDYSWMIGLPLAGILYWVGYQLIPAYKEERIASIETINNQSTAK